MLQNIIPNRPDRHGYGQCQVIKLESVRLSASEKNTSIYWFFIIKKEYIAVFYQNLT